MTHGYGKMNVGDLRLWSGYLLKDVEVSYLSFGELNGAGDNAVLVTHGFTSSPGMLRRDDVIAGEGSWADLVGPGAAIDTGRFFVVCPNMLGSCYGTTGPNTINADTGEPWGPDFPEYSVQDMVASQYALLKRLGVTRLRAVLGPSYGGIQALQWAIDHPDMVDAIGVAVSGPQFPADITPDGLLDALQKDPNWNAGWIYRNGGIAGTLERVRNQTLRHYGMVEVLRDQGLDPAAVDEAIAAMARVWAHEFDPNSLVALCKAGQRFDARSNLPHIKARMLWVISSSDRIFPPDVEVERMVQANTAADARVYLNLQSDYGHVASGADWLKWEPHLRQLLA